MDTLWTNFIDKLYCTLDLKRSAVGVKLLKSKDDYAKENATSLTRPINYCQMVAAASKGNCIKAQKKDFKCQSGVRVLGIDPVDCRNGQGENWTRLGLYKSAEISKKVRNDLTYLQEACYGVLVSPIEKLEKVPDVVIVIANAYNIMRILQGYGYSYGMPKAINMIGNQAMCLECTARPIGVKDINTSMLCIGTRHRAGWKDDEMAVGIPKEQFTGVVEGLMATLNQMENDSNKRVIEEKLKDKNIPFTIRYGYNYYMEC